MKISNGTFSLCDTCKHVNYAGPGPFIVFICGKQYVTKG